MEYSEFIDLFGLPIIGVLVFLFGVLVGLNLSTYSNKSDSD